MTPLAESLARSPELFPLLLDLPSDRIALAWLTEDDYVKASFLDHRLPKPKIVRSINFDDLQDAVAETNLDPSAQFIFHISHVGSTLISRLLGAHPNVFALRQPALLPELAYTHLKSATAPPQWRGERFEARFLALLKLWSRTFRRSQRSIIKIPSFVSELANLIFAQPYEPKAIFMFASPERHLANILRSQGSMRETQRRAAMRLFRLNNRLGTHFRQQDMSMSETVAMSWASEMTSLAEAASAFPERVLWVDFDQFLAAPEIMLSQCFAHLGVDTSPVQIGSILAGPHMRQYSKAPGQHYDASVRDAVIKESREKFSEEIRNGLRWLDDAAARYAPLKNATELLSATQK